MSGEFRWIDALVVEPGSSSSCRTTRSVQAEQHLWQPEVVREEVLEEDGVSLIDVALSEEVLEGGEEWCCPHHRQQQES